MDIAIFNKVFSTKLQSILKRISFKKYISPGQTINTFDEKLYFKTKLFTKEWNFIHDQKGNKTINRG